MPMSRGSFAAFSPGTIGLGLMCVLAHEARATGSEGTEPPAVVAAAGPSTLGSEAGERRSLSRRGRARVHLSPDDLEGTIWFSEEPHRRATVTLFGDVEIKEGKEIYVHFKDRIDDIFIIEVRWWNEQTNINVLEYGVLTQIEGNQYRYVEADHLDASCEQPEFPGIIGRGTFELLSRSEAELIQVGHLIDGSASGFTAFLEQVDTLPEAPVDQTYPVPCF